MNKIFFQNKKIKHSNHSNHNLLKFIDHKWKLMMFNNIQPWDEVSMGKTGATDRRLCCAALSIYLSTDYLSVAENKQITFCQDIVMKWVRSEPFIFFKQQNRVTPSTHWLWNIDNTFVTKVWTRSQYSFNSLHLLQVAK